LVFGEIEGDFWVTIKILKDFEDYSSEARMTNVLNGPKVAFLYVLLSLCNSPP
jgi:hypothetical protein